MAQRKARKAPADGVPDADIPETTADQFRRAKPVRQAMPGLIAAAKRARGRPRSPSPKQHVSLRLDSAVVAAFKAQGPGWQTRINAALVRELARVEKKRPA